MSHSLYIYFHSREDSSILGEIRLLAQAFPSHSDGISARANESHSYWPFWVRSQQGTCCLVCLEPIEWERVWFRRNALSLDQNGETHSPTKATRKLFTGFLSGGRGVSRVLTWPPRLVRCFGTGHCRHFELPCGAPCLCTEVAAELRCYCRRVALGILSEVPGVGPLHVATCEQVKLREAQRGGKNQILLPFILLPGSIFTSQKLLIGCAGEKNPSSVFFPAPQSWGVLTEQNLSSVTAFCWFGASL